MKRFLAAGLILTQAMGGTMAAAAGLESETRLTSHHAGAFAGARIRIPFGGEQAGKARATLAIAPTLHGQRSDGSVRTRFGQGIELGASAGEDLRVSYGGRPISQLAQRGKAPGGPKAGISTVGWVAIGVGTVALLYVAVLGLCAEEVICNLDDE